MYHTPSQLHKLGLRQDSKCWKCKQDNATFLHVTWDCPSIARFWEEVYGTIREVTGISLDCTSLVALLGYIEEAPPEKRRLTAIMFLLAKHRLAIHWGAFQSPCIKTWIQDIAYCQEQLAAFWDLMPMASHPKDISEPFVTWLKEKEGTITDSPT